MRQVSAKKKKTEVARMKTKREHLAEKIEQDGFVSCEECGRSYATVDTANYWLDWHHKVFRSQGGDDTLENASFLCRHCHMKVHGG